MMRDSNQNLGMSITDTERVRPLTDRVADEIRAVMGRRRVRQNELARRLGVSEMWVSYRLNGRQPIDLNDLSQIAEALGVSADGLVTAAVKGPTLQQHQSTPTGRALPPSRGTTRPPNRPAGRATGPGRTSRTRPQFAA